MDLQANPFATLTFISAPAVLTNASCVLLFGTGNRYGRAIDRVHELFEIVQKNTDLAAAEMHLRIRQLEAGVTRTQLIVRALRCFYTAVAGFVASTLVSLIGAVLVTRQVESGIGLSFALAFIAGALGVIAMITGAVLLARETTYSFRILNEEKTFISNQAEARLATLAKSSHE